MFFPLTERVPLWESSDHMVSAGHAFLEANDTKHPIFFSYLGPREISLEDVHGLNTALQERNPQVKSVLLLSSCPGFQASDDGERDGLIFSVAQLRAAHQALMDEGISLISACHQIVVGGTYLMHGLAAPVRLVTPKTVVHGTLPPKLAVQVSPRPTTTSHPAEEVLDSARSHGLFTAIVPVEELASAALSYLR